MQNVRDLIKQATSTEGGLVDELVEIYTRWATARVGWEEEINEIRQYVYATDTSTTSNSNLDFKNTTTIPKLAQIKMNLVTNYLSHLFPNANWAQWEGLTGESSVADVKVVIEGYVRSKLEHSDFESVAEVLLDDWTETGMCVVRTRYVTRVQKNDDQLTTIYAGTVAERLNPLNVMYDITASDLNSAMKGVRQVFSLGELKRMVTEDANSFMTEAQFQELVTLRKEVRNLATNINRQDSIVAKQQVDDGFGDLMNYYQGTTVEVIQFYGDFYDLDKDELLANHRITVIDRRTISQKIALETINGGDNIHISTWEQRTNSLAPMSPLSRIVGMQYKLDKLENLRADVFDRIANPPTVETGDVQFFGKRGAPGGRYVVEEGGDVAELKHDATVLNADFQLGNTMALMEELAGAPREAAGFRTPGEKTKFEVQLLDGAGNKVFMRKAKRFEREIIAPVLIDYLELGRRHLNVEDLIKVTDTNTDVASFVSITKDALTGQGKIVPKGASILADKANALQTINAILSSPVAAIIAPHMSRIRLTKAIEELGSLQQFGLFFPNIGLQEDAATQRFAASLSKSNEATNLTDGDLTEEPLDPDADTIDIQEEAGNEIS